MILIRDILMYAGALIGTSMIAYVRISFSERQKKSPNVALDYNSKEEKLRKIARIILIVTIVLAMIPVKNL